MTTAAPTAGAGPPPERKGMSTGRKVLLVLGGLVLTAILLQIIFGSGGKNDAFKPQNEFKLDPWISIHIGALDMSINKAVLYLVLAAGFTVGSMLYIARRMQQHPNRVQTVEFLRHSPLRTAADIEHLLVFRRGVVSPKANPTDNHANRNTVSTAIAPSASRKRRSSCSLRLACTVTSATQPAPFSRGQTAVVPRSKVGVVEDGKRLALVREGMSLQQLVDGLNALGIGPRDMIAILQAIKAAGAIQADIEVM